MFETDNLLEQYFAIVQAMYGLALHVREYVMANRWNPPFD
jgi:hypothetical protein